VAIPSNRMETLKTRDIPTLTNPHVPLNNNGCNPPLSARSLIFNRIGVSTVLAERPEWCREPANCSEFVVEVRLEAEPGLVPNSVLNSDPIESPGRSDGRFRTVRWFVFHAGFPAWRLQNALKPRHCGPSYRVHFRHSWHID